MSDRPALFLIYCIFRGRIICTKFSVSIYVGHLERNANTTINPNYSSSWHLRSSLAPTTEFLYNYCFVSTTFSLFNIYFAESDWFEVIFRDKSSSSICCISPVALHNFLSFASFIFFYLYLFCQLFTQVRM